MWRRLRAQQLWLVCLVASQLPSASIGSHTISSDVFSLFCVAVISVKVTVVQHLFAPTRSAQFQSPLLLLKYTKKPEETQHSGIETSPPASVWQCNCIETQTHQHTTVNAHSGVGQVRRLRCKLCVGSAQYHNSALSLLNKQIKKQKTPIKGGVWWKYCKCV